DDIRSPSRHWHHALLRNYFASRGIKHALMNIARATDEAYLAKLRASSLAMTGKELPNQEKKLYLFCGPPGTGKTFGMKIIAAECGLDAYQLKLKKIDYDAPDAFRRALQRLQDQSARSGRSVAVFVDEAEVLFGSRASMQDYHSVLVTQKKQIVTEFLTWVDGLETKASGAASVILIMATNLESSMDEAILSRVAETVHFDLPNFRQCRQFWAGKAQHLRLWDRLLIAWDCASSLSFRDLEEVHRKVLAMDAELEAPAGSTTLSHYLHAMHLVSSDRARAERTQISYGRPALQVEQRVGSDLWLRARL
ncbi:unnamed protein product, partial [Durusdinium trenchii]